MPISEAPYKRSYKSGSSRGQSQRITCNKCGAFVPKWKTIPVKTYSGIGRVDKAVWNAMTWEAKSALKMSRSIIRVCPKCAKHYGFFKIGISRSKKGTGERGDMRYGERRHKGRR